MNNIDINSVSDCQGLIERIDKHYQLNHLQ